MPRTLQTNSEGHYYFMNRSSLLVQSPSRRMVSDFIFNLEVEHLYRQDTQKRMNSLNTNRLQNFLITKGYRLLRDCDNFYIVTDGLGYLQLKAKKLRYVLQALDLVGSYRDWWNDSPETRNRKESLFQKAERLGYQLEEDGFTWTLIRGRRNIFQTFHQNHIRNLLNFLESEYFLTHETKEELNKATPDSIDRFLQTKNRRLTCSRAYTLTSISGSPQAYGSSLINLLASQALIGKYLDWKQPPYLTLVQ